MREAWDRFIRDASHMRNVEKYIHENPVKAGLCCRPEDWPWSSVSRNVPGNTEPPCPAKRGACHAAAWREDGSSAPPGEGNRVGGEREGILRPSQALSGAVAELGLGVPRHGVVAELGLGVPRHGVVAELGLGVPRHGVVAELGLGVPRHGVVAELGLGVPRHGCHGGRAGVDSASCLR